VTAAEFLYDGDGRRVWSRLYNASGTLVADTAYPGPHQEWRYDYTTTPTSWSSKRYYSLGGVQIGMREITSAGGNTFYLMVSDHLGSTSAMVNTSTWTSSGQRYPPLSL
jgi:hypothetical protein